MRHREAITALTVVALAVSSLACKKSREPMSLNRVLIDAPREFDDAPDQREEIRAKVTALLQQDETVEFDTKMREATHVLKVRVGPVVHVSAKPPEEGAAQDAHNQRGPDNPPPPPTEEALEPDLPKPGDAFRVVELVASPKQEVPSFTVTGKFEPHEPRIEGVVGAFRDAWSVLGEQRRLQRADTEDVVVALKSEDVRLRDFAVRVLGDRKEKEAVPALVEYLESESRPELVLRTIGSLVSIGDERAVDPLIELTRQKDAGFVLQVIFAVGAIGGRTAEAFLVTLASGHPSPQVQQGAEDALKEMPGRPQPASPN